MPIYRTERFSDRLEIDDDEEIAAAELSTKPSGEHIALIEEGESDETYRCAGTLNDNSRCSREVDGPNEYCWDHEDQQ